MVKAGPFYFCVLLLLVQVRFLLLLIYITIWWHRRASNVFANFWYSSEEKILGKEVSRRVDIGCNNDRKLVDFGLIRVTVQ